jgi:UDP-glucuronate decarboxylase
MDTMKFYNYDSISSIIDFSKMKNKKILITGATGLIGLHLISALQSIRKQYNIQIYCWVNSDIESIHSDIFVDCNIIRGNLTDIKNIEKLQSEFVEILDGFDYVIHAAGYGQPQKFMNDKLNTITLNTTTTLNLFKLLNRGGTFLFCSTSEIYSGIDEESICEQRIGTTSPDHPRACYIEAKRCGEAICHAQAIDYNVKIARISLAYGTGTKKNDSRVLNNIIQKAIINKKIDLLDSGKSIRTYCYITDVVEMILNIMLKGKHIIYNVAGKSKISIADLANNVGNMMNVDVIIPSDDNKSLNGNPTIVNLDIDRYVNEFSKIKFIDITEGLNQTIMWQKGLYNEL